MAAEIPGNGDMDGLPNLPTGPEGPNGDSLDRPDRIQLPQPGGFKGPGGGSLADSQPSGIPQLEPDTPAGEASGFQDFDVLPGVDPQSGLPEGIARGWGNVLGLFMGPDKERFAALSPHSKRYLMKSLIEKIPRTASGFWNDAVEFHNGLQEGETPMDAETTFAELGLDPDKVARYDALGRKLDGLLDSVGNMDAEDPRERAFQTGNFFSGFTLLCMDLENLLQPQEDAEEPRTNVKDIRRPFGETTISERQGVWAGTSFRNMTKYNYANASETRQSINGDVFSQDLDMKAEDGTKIRFHQQGSMRTGKVTIENVAFYEDGDDGEPWGHKLFEYVAGDGSPEVLRFDGRSREEKKHWDSIELTDENGPELLRGIIAGDELETSMGLNGCPVGVEEISDLRDVLSRATPIPHKDPQE